MCQEVTTYTDPNTICATGCRICVSVSHSAACSCDPNTLKTTGKCVKMEQMSTQVSDTTAPWRGPLTVEGIETGDGRQFDSGSLTWADLPLPLRRCRPPGESSPIRPMGRRSSASPIGATERKPRMRTPSGAPSTTTVRIFSSILLVLDGHFITLIPFSLRAVKSACSAQRQESL